MMNKKELIILLLVPIVVLVVSYYGVHQIDLVSSNHQANLNITNNIDAFVTKIQSETPEQTQLNLIRHINHTKKMLALELESEQLYIDVMRTFFNNALIVSLIWVALVMLIFFTSNNRNARQNL
jgi:hypothetical protein